MTDQPFAATMAISATLKDHNAERLSGTSYPRLKKSNDPTTTVTV